MKEGVKVELQPDFCGLGLHRDQGTGKHIMEREGRKRHKAMHTVYTKAD